MAGSLNLFNKSSVSVGRQYPSVDSVEEIELSGLDHLLKMTSRLPSASAGTQVLQQCIATISETVADASHELGQTSSASMKM